MHATVSQHTSLQKLYLAYLPDLCLCVVIVVMSCIRGGSRILRRGRAELVIKQLAMATVSRSILRSSAKILTSEKSHKYPWVVFVEIEV